MDEFRLGHGAQPDEREREGGSSRGNHDDDDAPAGCWRWTYVRRRYIDVAQGSGRTEWWGAVKLLSIPQASQISFTLPLQPF